MQGVLLIEDDPAMEMAMRPKFEGAGVALDYVEDGYAAIDRIRTRPYDAVILDLVLHSGLSGFGVLSYLEQEHPALIERVFLVTGMSDQTVARAAPELMPRFFRKPVEIDVVVQAVLSFIARKPSPARSREPVVLIVDDDLSSATAMQDIVEAAGWGTKVVGDGRAAIAVIAEGGVDAVVLDLIMPGLDGASVIGFLRLREAELLSRTIIVSGLPAAFRERLSTPEICASLEKPLRPAALLEALARCVGSRKEEEGR
jgi:CheY-like chemotaxis protein